MTGLRTIPPLKKTPAVSAAGTKATPPPAQRSGGRPLQIVDPFRPLIAVRGPAELHLGQKRVTGSTGPGPQPLDFAGSGAEWVWHWASRKYFYAREHLDPMQPPFDGGVSWVFADPIGAGVTAARDPGEGTADFEYLTGAQTTIVKIQGFFWHYGQGGAQSARDLYLATHSGAAGDRVVVINDGDYMFDETANVAIKLLADILAGRYYGGVLREPRYADFAQGIGA